MKILGVKYIGIRNPCKQIFQNLECLEEKLLGKKFLNLIGNAFHQKLIILLSVDCLPIQS